MPHYFFANSRQSSQRFRRHALFSIGLLLTALVELTNGLGNMAPLTSKARAQSKSTTSTGNDDDSKEYSAPSFDFLIRERNVSMRSVNWCSAMLPIQEYRAVATMEQHPQHSDSSIRQEDPNKYNTDDDDDDDDAQLRDILSSTSSSNLSRSSRHMIEKYESLSSSQKEQLLYKIKAEERATMPLDPSESLRILYCDAHICVVNKPSGVLSVPGPRRNPSLAALVYDCLKPAVDLDQMVVHRLDMATSGIIVYALSLEALQQLHKDFKDRNVQKTYQALVHGHMDSSSCQEGEINIALERDPANPPFMRIVQPKDEDNYLDLKKEEEDNASESASSSPLLLAVGKTHKFWTQAPKESLTTWSVISKEYRNGKPVTRLELRPWTGRTHQLRVHCAAALGAIVGDDIYGNRELGSLSLHAMKLCIYHPISGAPMIFEADAPF
jgi:tRNA pseudouridine32 synthase/23S rRNA pseudouridine746 synthase